MLGRSLNVLAARQREKIQDLEQERAKVTAILDGMVEGVIAVDGHEHILLMNERARGIFGLGAARGERKPFLEVIRNAELHEVFRASRTGTSGDGRPPRGAPDRPAARVLQVHALPLELAGRRARARHGRARRDRAAPPRAGAHRVRGERLARAAHAAHRDPRLSRDAARRRARGAGARAEVSSRSCSATRNGSGRLIDDLTELSNIELGKVTLRLDAVRLDEAVESVVAIIRPRARRGGWPLTSDVAGDVPAVRADHDRLAQILINLVDNAVKYTPRGRRRADRRAAGSRPAWWRSSSRTRASGSHRRICRGSPSASTASTRRARASSAARDSASRSSSTSCTRTAVSWRSRASRARAPIVRFTLPAADPPDAA